MISDKKKGRIVGVLLLVIFVLGVTTYQILQGPVLFEEDFYNIISTHSDQIILSAILTFLSGAVPIIIAILVFPIFKLRNPILAYSYLSLSILNFIILSIDGATVLSMLDLGQEFARENISSRSKVAEGLILYNRHWWTHHISLLFSCFPVFVFFLSLHLTRLVPKILSMFGMFAAFLMLVEMSATISGNSISMNLMLPLAIVQLFLPFWLIAKGFKPRSAHIN